MARKIAQRSTDARRNIAARQPFETYGNMSGVTGWVHPGYLRGRALDAWHADRNAADYIVLSHSTPIAWHVPGAGWTYIDRHFSPSTATVQAQVRYALSAAGIEYRELQTKQHLTDAMMAMLYWAARYGNRHLYGAEWRTARALVNKGLGTIENGHFLINDNGRDY